MTEEDAVVAQSGHTGLRQVVDRHCTDTVWVLIFLVANGLLGYLLHLAGSYGAASRLIVLRDFMGRECGETDQIDYPFLFFCKGDSGNLVLEYPICIEACPNSSATHHRCWMGEGKTIVNVTDYPTKVFGGLACGADNETLRSQQRQWVAEKANFISRTLLMLQVWRPVAISMALAVSASVLYILMLGACASCLVWMGLLTLSLVPSIWGFVLLQRWWHGALTGSGALVYGTLLVGLGFSFCCLSCCTDRNIGRASVLIELSCKCVTNLPLLRVGPVLLLTTKYAYFAFIIRGIVQLYSLAFTDRIDDGEEVSMDGTLLMACLFYLIFMMFWTQNVFDALWDTLLADLTQFWYISGGVHGEVAWPFGQSERAIWRIFRYHFGTMIFGSLVVGFVRPIRLVIGAVTAPGRRNDQFPLCSCMVDTCCGYVVDLYSRWLELLSRNAYMEVAMSGAPFWPAAKTALEVTRTDEALFTHLNGETWFLQLAGIGLTMVIGNLWACFVYSKCMSTFIIGELRSLNPWEQDDAGAYITLCTLVSGLTALPFMLLFDIVSDTILYCHLTAKRLRQPAKATNVISDMGQFLWDTVSRMCLGYGVEYEDDPEEAAEPVRTGNRTRGVRLVSHEGDSDSSSSGETTASEGGSAEAPAEPPGIGSPLSPAGAAPFTGAAGPLLGVGAPAAAARRGAAARGAVLWAPLYQVGPRSALAGPSAAEVSAAGAVRRAPGAQCRAAAPMQLAPMVRF